MGLQFDKNLETVRHLRDILTKAFGDDSPHFGFDTDRPPRGPLQNEWFNGT